MAAQVPLALSAQHAAEASGQVTFVHGCTLAREHATVLAVPAVEEDGEVVYRPPRATAIGTALAPPVGP